MAELLVKAKGHWMDDLKQKDVDKMSTEKRESYDARTQIGDVIVVRPDGWKWGKCECLPDFIVVKMPDVKLEDAKKYEEVLNVEDGINDDGSPKIKMLKRRKYQLPKTVIDAAKLTTNTVVSVSSLQKDSFVSNITQKVS